MRNYSNVIVLTCWISVVLGLFSCDNNKSENDNKKLIHVELYPGNLPPLSKLTDVVESVRIIPLETGPDVMIGDVGRSSIGKEYIAFMSRGGTNYLYLFNKEGKFIRQLGRKGKGPGEYVGIRSVSILEQEKMVFINDWPGRPFIGYSFSGNLMKSFQLPPKAWVMEILDTATFAAACSDEYEVLIINTLLKDTIKCLPKYNDVNSADPRFSGNPESGIFYQAAGRDTIFRVNQSGLEPVISFDFGAGHISREEARRPSVQQPADKIYPFFGVYQCGHIIHVHLQHTQSQGAPDYYSIFIDTQTSQSWLMPVFTDADDILFCCNLFFEASTPEGELMVKADAIDLIEALPQIEKNKNFKYSKELLNQIKNLKEDDNPVLVLFKLKNR